MPRKTRVTKRRAEGKTVVDGYARVSMETQATEGTSMDNQPEKIRMFCQLHNLELLRIVTDPGESAKSLDRPGIQDVLGDLRRGRVDGLVVYKLDRLTRSLGDWDYLIRTFFDERGGRQLFSVSESIDTRSASGRMVLNMIMTVAAWEREVIGERTSDALQGKIRRGERCGRVRYGYALASDGVHLVPVPHEQETIQRMREWRVQGYTYQRMVDMLAELGIETKEGGRLWLPATVHRILARPIA
jgi:site-specific DNA recombinase